VAVEPETHSSSQLLSDDGTVLIDGVEAKRLADPVRKQFRGRFITLPSLLDARAQAAPDDDLMNRRPAATIP
jgi:hypothetical protein